MPKCVYMLSEGIMHDVKSEVQYKKESPQGEKLAKSYLTPGLWPVPAKMAGRITEMGKYVRGSSSPDPQCRLQR